MESLDALKLRTILTPHLTYPDLRDWLNTADKLISSRKKDQHPLLSAVLDTYSDESSDHCIRILRAYLALNLPVPELSSHYSFHRMEFVTKIVAAMSLNELKMIFHTKTSAVSAFEESLIQALYKGAKFGPDWIDLDGLLKQYSHLYKLRNSLIKTSTSFLRSFSATIPIASSVTAYLEQSQAWEPPN